MALALLLILLVFVQGAKPAQAEDEPEFEGQVVGGAAVPNGKYPFMAALLNTRYGNNAYQQQFCGGTLIDRDSVLTAAHCVSGASARPLRVCGRPDGPQKLTRPGAQGVQNFRSFQIQRP